jgi:hypothetical protein
MFDPLEVGRDRKESVLSRVELESEQTYQRLKLCKRGHREQIVARVCGVTFEKLPMWLWTIRLAEWSHIYITDTDELKWRQYHVSTWEFVKAKLVMVTAAALPDLKFIDLWMISGSSMFIRELRCPLGTPVVGWMSNGGRRKPSIGDPDWSWSKVSLALIGGVTKATGMFGSVGLGQLDIDDDQIRRTIGTVIKFSERPSPCNLPFRDPHYTVSDRLSLHRLDLPVIFASGFSRTGWGVRSLTDSELAQAFDLPSFVTWESVKGSNVVPIHMFRVVLDAALNTFGPAIQDRAGSRPKLHSEMVAGCRWSSPVG